MEKFNKPPKNISESIWTIRLTPSESHSFPIVEERLIKFIKCLTKPKSKKELKHKHYMIYKEKSKYQRVHYHARFHTLYKKSNMYRLKKLLLTEFKGNAHFSFHPVYYNQHLKDENFIKSMTYIAKDGQCVASNYSDDDIKLFIALGNSFKKLKTKGKIANIINTYEIKDFNKVQIVDFFIKYHEDNHLNLPILFQARKQIEQIQLMTSVAARKRYIEILKFDHFEE